jgi:AhpC/TSA family
MKAFLATLIIVAVTIAASAQSPQSPLAPPKMPVAAKTDTGLGVGDKAPDFALPNGDGKLVMLSEYAGRTPVVLVFYRGFW